VCGVVGESEFLLLLNEMAVDLGFFLAKTEAGPRGLLVMTMMMISTTISKRFDPPLPSLDSRVGSRGGKLEEM
jgi:hypothetical protein